MTIKEPELRDQTLVFVRSSSEPLDGSEEYLLDSLAKQSSKTILAVPRGRGEEHPIPESNYPVLYFDAPSEMDGILTELVVSFAKERDQLCSRLLLVSDQLLGPANGISVLWERLDALTEPIRLLFAPDPHFSGEQGTESLALPTLFLQIERDILLSSQFLKILEDSSGTQNMLERAEKDGFPFGVAYESTAAEYVLRDEVPLAPLLPWAFFTSDPLLLERWAVSSRDAYKAVESSLYPIDLFWNHLTHAVPPQTWYTNLALLDIPRGVATETDADLHTAVCAHIYYADMAEEMVTYASHVPSPVSLVITTATETKKVEIESQLVDHPGLDHFESVEVRVVSTNDGRDVSAFLVDCADVIRNPRFDIIVKLHSKKSVQDPHPVGSWFQRHLFENLLENPGHVRDIYARFASEPQLGMVFPPIIHMGLPTMGNGWTTNRLPAEKIAPRLGIDIPFDLNTPLSPYGSMFIARREPLLPLVEAGFTPDEYPSADNYRDGSLAHVLERLYSYVVFSQGYFARCVQTPANAEISAVTLEYKLDCVSSFLHPHVLEQVKILGSGPGNIPTTSSLRSQLQRHLVARLPRVGTALTNVWLKGKRIYSRLPLTRRP